MKPMIIDIKPNQVITTYLAVESMQIRKNHQTRQNFLELVMLDKTGSMKAYLWENPLVIAAELKEKTIVKVQGITTLANGHLIMNVKKIRQAKENEFDILDFMETVPGGIDPWYEKLMECVGSIQDGYCKRVIDAFLQDDSFRECFVTSPGGVIHHNYVGGLVEHTTTTMDTATQLAANHPGLLNRDVLLTGAFLHDIGKTRELSWQVSYDYTTEGKLLGHIAIGISMLEKKLATLNEFPEDLSLFLKHMIISHHGDLAFGSPARPATAEAITLNLIDSSDSKINHVYTTLGHSDPEKLWSDFDKILNTQIYQKKYINKKANNREAHT